MGAVRRAFGSLLALGQSKSRDNKTTMLMFLCKLLQEKGETCVGALQAERDKSPAGVRLRPASPRALSLYGPCVSEVQRSARAPTDRRR